MSDSIKRFQQLRDLRWKELCKTCGFTGDHLKWHESPGRRSWAARGGVSLLPPPAGSRVKFYGSKGEQISWGEWKRRMPTVWAERGNSPAVIDSIGISETVTLARARYTSTAEDYYLLLWIDTNGEVDFTEEIRRLVMREVGDLWGNDEWHRDWFDRACRPKVEEALTPLVIAESSRALRLKIQHLENPHLSLKSLVKAGGNLSLAFSFEQSDRGIEAAAQLLAAVRADPAKDEPIGTADGANAEQQLPAPTGPHPSNSAPTATNGATPEPATPEAAAIFRRVGDIWVLTFNHKSVHIRHLKGIGYIAELLRAPRVPIEAAQLAGVDVESTGLAALPGFELADEKAIKEVRANLAEIQAALQNAAWPQKGDLEEKAAKLEDWLAEVENHQGQARKAAGTAQRARSAVTMAINRAIKEISEPHPALGAHLHNSIDRGTMLSYAPADLPDWSF